MLEHDDVQAVDHRLHAGRQAGHAGTHNADIAAVGLHRGRRYKGGVGDRGARRHGGSRGKDGTAHCGTLDKACEKSCSWQIPFRSMNCQRPVAQRDSFCWVPASPLHAPKGGLVVLISCSSWHFYEICVMGATAAGCWPNSKTH